MSKIGEFRYQVKKLTGFEPSHIVITELDTQTGQIIMKCTCGWEDVASDIIGARSKTYDHFRRELGEGVIIGRRFPVSERCDK